MNQPITNSKGLKVLAITMLLILGGYFFVQILMGATGFLIPLVIALMLSLICIPLARKLERFHFNRAISALVCVFITFLIFISFFGLLSLQVSQLSDKWPEIQSKTKEGLLQVENFIQEQTGLGFEKEIVNIFPSTKPQNENLSNQSSQKSDSINHDEENKITSDFSHAESLLQYLPSGMFSRVGGWLMGFFGFLANSLLVIIYLFFFTLYREKIKLSILKFFQEDDQEKVKEVLSNTVNLAQSFLGGRLLLVLFLGIIYSIGLSISGIDNAILVSILAAILTLIPYVGNIVGFALAMFMAVVSGGSFGMYIGVFLTFSITQFTESYILQPYIIGDKVNINPIATILVVVIGGVIWGVAGMILAIPLTGIFKIICDAIPSLQPIGYLLGDEDL